MIVKPLTEHHLEFLSVKGGCTGLSESILVKMSHCWKSHVRFINVLEHDSLALIAYSLLQMTMLTYPVGLGLNFYLHSCISYSSIEGSCESAKAEHSMLDNVINESIKGIAKLVHIPLR